MAELANDGNDRKCQLKPVAFLHIFKGASLQCKTQHIMTWLKHSVRLRKLSPGHSWRVAEDVKCDLITVMKNMHQAA